MTETGAGRAALVTGGSRGLGRALTLALVQRGWRVTINGRDQRPLDALLAEIPGPGAVTAVAGDVADPSHRARLAETAAAAGGLRLLVNNASILGPSPLPELAAYPAEALAGVYAVNAFAPLALTQLLLPVLERSGGRVVNLSSDAAVAAYEGWGGYGSSKAALDHLTAVMAVERPSLRLYAFDPGDMATDMQQQAFPDDDISDRAAPETVVPALFKLIDGDLPSGRYRAVELLASPQR
ncbi:MAG: SDR family oxidoreductase [Candidatus Dormibacteria bacterium]